MASLGELGPWMTGNSTGWGKNSRKSEGVPLPTTDLGEGRLDMTVDY
jgi:hypothetical protein